MLTCKKCTRSFEATKATALYCSSTCRVAAHRGTQRRHLARTQRLLRALTDALAHGDETSLHPLLRESHSYLRSVGM